MSGTLKHVTGYTGFSQDVSLQSGNFLALKFTAPDNATVKVGLAPSMGSGMVTLDEDMNAVLRVANNLTQHLKVVVTDSDGKSTTKVYDLSGLECK